MAKSTVTLHVTLCHSPWPIKATISRVIVWLHMRNIHNRHTNAAGVFLEVSYNTTTFESYNKTQFPNSHCPNTLQIYERNECSSVSCSDSVNCCHSDTDEPEHGEVNKSTDLVKKKRFIIMYGEPIFRNKIASCR